MKETTLKIYFVSPSRFFPFVVILASFMLSDQLDLKVEHDVFGHRETYDLKPDGENIPVTNANRQGNLNIIIP